MFNFGAYLVPKTLFFNSCFDYRRWQQPWLTLSLWVFSLMFVCLPPAHAATKAVLVESVLHHDAGVSHQLNCAIEAPTSFRVSSFASAELVKLLPVGTTVKKGQLIARQDDSFLSAQINIIKTDIESARVAKLYASEEFNRLNRLSKTGLAAATELNNLKFQLDSSELKIQRLQQELKLVEVRVNRLNHFAPFDAQVTAVMAELGSQLTEGQPVLQLIATEDKQLACLLPVISYSDQAALKQHKFDLRGTTIKLREISQQLDSKGENIILLFNHPAKDRRDLLVGQRETVQMMVFSNRITRLPNEAVELDGENYRSWRVNDDNKVERIEIKILGTSESHYIVDSVLRPGDKVVVSGQHGLLPELVVKPEQRGSTHRSGLPFE